MNEERNPEAQCVACGDDLFPAPTDNSWAYIPYRPTVFPRGICFDCIEQLHEVVHAEVLGEEND